MRRAPAGRAVAWVAGGAVALAGAVSGCAEASSTSGSAGARPGSVTVFAAASLTDAFGAEAAAYKKRTGQSVSLSFAGSQSLAAQIQQGAPADALATADLITMDRVRSQVRGTPSVFARNRLAIVVAPGNPKHVRTLGDLARRRLVVVLAAPSVPAGHYTDRALAAAHLTVHAKSLEDNVRGVLTKVEVGEADAGVVYRTDAASAGDRVSSVDVPNSPLAAYAIAALDTNGKDFAAFMLSPPAQTILRRYGFLPP